MGDLLALFIQITLLIATLSSEWHLFSFSHTYIFFHSLNSGLRQPAVHGVLGFRGAIRN